MVKRSKDLLNDRIHLQNPGENLPALKSQYGYLYKGQGFPILRYPQANKMEGTNLKFAVR